ncbi:hypothetical protein HgNV_050 [Homarus gammarus nudivirus]|uniref:Uncharacterized protein n=1 Tax=Homarus gammarus nudivirus TaxID=2509616 RepID=A0A411HB64_9VIRU|nr:hypothetical protein KM727_gp50 [Homarus gammarus nudivirus]QBB28655.1 hypothetical protein HgNV_050 [Homarus gammarus nudivirus]
MSNFNEMLNQSMNISKGTTPEAIRKEEAETSEMQKAKAKTIIAGNNSDFLYPTIIILPMIIAIIGILTLPISAFSKFIFVLCLLLSLVTYVLQYKNYNISKPLEELSNKFSIKSTGQSDRKAMFAA